LNFLAGVPSIVDYLYSHFSKLTKPLVIIDFLAILSVIHALFVNTSKQSKVQHSQSEYWTLWRMRLEHQPEYRHSDKVRGQGNQNQRNKVEPDAALDHFADGDITRTEGNRVWRGGHRHHKGTRCGQRHWDGQEQNVNFAGCCQANTNGNAAHNRQEGRCGCCVGCEFRQDKYQGCNRAHEQEDWEASQPLSYLTDP